MRDRVWKRWLKELKKEREDIVHLAEDTKRNNEILDEMKAANESSVADLQREKNILEQ